jgi:hypothetical protein
MMVFPASSNGVVRPGETNGAGFSGIHHPEYFGATRHQAHEAGFLILGIFSARP